jgi:ArsR family transcriptional regulator
MLLSEAMPKTGASDADEQIYEMQVRICKAFANTTRLRILDLLARREHTVSDMQTQLGLSAPNISQHLAILKAAGVVSTRRNGKQIFCSLTIPEVKQACGLIREVLRAQVRNDRKLVV